MQSLGARSMRLCRCGLSTREWRRKRPLPGRISQGRVGGAHSPFHNCRQGFDEKSAMPKRPEWRPRVARKTHRICEIASDIYVAGGDGNWKKTETQWEMRGYILHIFHTVLSFFDSIVNGWKGPFRSVTLVVVRFLWTTSGSFTKAFCFYTITYVGTSEIGHHF